MEASAAIDAMTQAEDAPPRSNGELVFDAPWQGRIFGAAVALQESGRFPWDAFRGQLVKAIAEGECLGEAYYESWLKALDSLLVASEAIDPAELEQRTREYLHGDRDEVF